MSRARFINHFNPRKVHADGGVVRRLRELGTQIGTRVSVEQGRQAQAAGLGLDGGALGFYAFPDRRRGFELQGVIEAQLLEIAFARLQTIQIKQHMPSARIVRRQRGFQ